MISASEAKALGLVSQVISADDLQRQVQGLARRIASKDSLPCVRPFGPFVAALIYNCAGLVREAQLFGDLCDSEDKREGVGAFLEKRQPQFRDR